MAIIKDHLSGDVHEDLRQLSEESLDRRTEAADPLKFMQWATESLRLHRESQDQFVKDHQNLLKAADSATIGLKRLEALVRYISRDELQHLQDLHRTFVHNNRGTGYLIEKCKKILNETTMTWQLMGETLVQPLADRQKKKGIQQEFGLRLRDIDYYFDRCKTTIEEQKTRDRQLAEGIQNLMNVASIKLPPHVKQTMDREDAVKQLAIDYQVDLKKGKDFVNPAKAAAVGAGKIRRLGDASLPESPAPASPPSASIESVSKPTTPAEVSPSKDSFNYKYAGMAIAAGLALGFIFLK